MAETKSNPKLFAHTQGVRRRRTIRDHLSKGCIRRLARRGGVKRISALIYNEAREFLRLYLKHVIRDSIVYCEYSKRKTVQVEDVIRALQYQGKRLYGFDIPRFSVSKKTSARMKEDIESPSCSSTLRSTSSITTRSSSALRRSPPTAKNSDSETE